MLVRGVHGGFDARHERSAPVYPLRLLKVCYAEYRKDTGDEHDQDVIKESCELHVESTRVGQVIAMTGQLADGSRTIADVCWTADNAAAAMQFFLDAREQDICEINRSGCFPVVAVRSTVRGRSNNWGVIYHFRDHPHLRPQRVDFEIHQVQNGQSSFVYKLSASSHNDLMSTFNDTIAATMEWPLPYER
jgi:hypothetical protein